MLLALKHFVVACSYSWAEQGDARETQAVFDRMVDDYLSGNQAAKPDINCFNKILKAWGFSKTKNRAREAEVMFQRLGEFKLSPNCQTLNEMINVWSNSGKSQSGEMAESYLKQIKERGLVPTVFSYRAAIDAWSRSRDSRASVRAGALLEELLWDVKCQKIRLPLPKPYRRFLRSIANSKIPIRNKQAKKLLQAAPGGKVPNPLLPPL